MDISQRVTRESLLSREYLKTHYKAEREQAIGLAGGRSEMEEFLRQAGKLLRSS